MHDASVRGDVEKLLRVGMTALERDQARIDRAPVDFSNILLWLLAQCPSDIQEYFPLGAERTRYFFSSFVRWVLETELKRDAEPQERILDFQRHQFAVGMLALLGIVPSTMPDFYPKEETDIWHITGRSFDDMCESASAAVKRLALDEAQHRQTLANAVLYDRKLGYEGSSPLRNRTAIIKGNNLPTLANAFLKLLSVRASETDAFREVEKYYYLHMERLVEECDSGLTAKRGPGVRTLAPLIQASKDAAQWAGPRTLPEVGRLARLGSNPGAILDRFPLAILGEGGSGKSVIATQFFRHYSHEGRLALFVPCAYISTAEDLSCFQSLDVAFARALGDQNQTLTQIIDGIFGAVVIVDTIDLVLSEDNASEVAAYLFTLSTRTNLVVTCRAREWDDLLAQDPRTRIPTILLGQLPKAEIIEWATGYVERELYDVPESRAFITSLESSLERDSSVTLFGSPVRLAMTCEIYAATGALPDKLTVTSLYEAYWEAKIERDRRGQRSSRSTPQVNAAKNIASRIWRSSGTRFTEFVGVDERDAGVSALLSEGVLYASLSKVGFFHQTFAEYAVARHLAAEATTTDWQRLRMALTNGYASDWGILAHLITLPIDPQTFEDVINAIPRETPEGLRMLLKGIGQRNDPHHLASVVAKESSQQPANLAGALDCLLSVDPQVYELCLPILADLDIDDRIRSRFLVALSRLIERSTSSAKTTWIILALGHTLKARTDKARTMAVEFCADTLGQSPTAYDPQRLFAIYDSCPDGVRAYIADCVLHSTQAIQVEFLHMALEGTAPLKAEESLIALCRGILDDEQLRNVFGWISWQDFLELEYPDGWRLIQTRLVAELLDSDQIAELLLALIQPKLDQRKKYLDSAKLIARSRPRDIAAAIAQVELPQTESIAGSFAHILRELIPTGDVGIDLASVLRPLRAACPLEVEPVLAELAVSTGNAATSLGDLVAMSQADDPATRRVVRNTWSTYFNTLATSDILSYAGKLRAALRARIPAENKLLARLEARLSLIDRAAQRRLKAICLGPGNAHLASEAATTMATFAHELKPEDHVTWLIELMESDHGDFVGRVAQLMADENMASHMTQANAEVLIRRVTRSIRRPKESQTLEKLLGVLAAVARTEYTPITVDMVESLLHTISTALKDWRDRGYSTDSKIEGLYQRLNYTITAIALPILPEDRLISHVTELLVAYDVERIGNKPIRALANTLIVTTRKYPLAWSEIDACWSATYSQNKQAMAEWITNRHVPGYERIAKNMARRDDCPSGVAHYIHNRLREK